MIFLLECSLRVSGVLAAVFLLTFLLQRNSATLRHLIWASAFAVALTTPLLETFGPKLVKPPMLATHAARLTTHTGIVTISTAAINVAPLPAEPPPPSRSIPYAALIWGIWTAGVLACAIRLLRGVTRVRAIRNSAVPSEVFEGVPVTESESTAVAMTLGVLKPLIVLPMDHRNWSVLRKQTVFLHELAHVRRRDCLMQWLPHMVCALHWFNPLAWLARAQMLCEAERACDDAVISTGASGPDFARDLLDLAQSVSRKGPDLMMISVTTRLEHRIARLLDPSANRKPLTRTHAVCAVAAALMLLLPLAGVRAQDAVKRTAQAVPAHTPAPSTEPPREVDSAAPQVQSPEPRQTGALSVSVTDPNGATLPNPVTFTLIASPQMRFRDRVAFQPQVAGPTGTISGIVTDQSGARVPNAAISLTALAISLVAGSAQIVPVRTLAADGLGTWTATGLPPGSYQLEVQVRGFATFRRALNLAAGANLQLQQPLMIGQASEIMTITAAAPHSPVVAPQTPTIGGVVQPLRLIFGPKPAYPAALRDQGAEGTVQITAIVGKSGEVVSARAEGDQTSAELTEAALAAVRQWRYQPALLNGMPVETLTNITIQFQLAP